MKIEQYFIAFFDLIAVFLNVNVYMLALVNAL